MASTEDANDTITKAVEQLYRIKAEKKALEEQEAQYLAFFKDYDGFSDTGSYVFGDYVVDVSANTRFDDDLAKQVLGQGYSQYTKVVADSAKIKKHFGTTEYAKMSKKFAHRISVKKVGD